ncbi:polysaccharide biosynthesis tyrosine autokinase [Nocardioides massiliensis]|uniref:non-specific protein-tyrosine kinase n=1 Tax=Nocardioides massiliensis TaxID=1325935 RepID=A0ABT9NNY7_9ACTN|nr:polysaccharide biosynthesis tyrosine autokinase [Nocardioides massiliensis]MDP9821790.1 receptor protein-tyrosine kinase [Nocardioides massiliensis]
MELRDYLRIMRRRWKSIVAVFVLCVAAAALLTFQATPQYSSTARLFVSTMPSDTNEAYQGSLFASQRVTSYADLVNGRELTERVADRLGVADDENSLASQVTARAVPDTVILELSVTDPRPSQAQEIAQAYADELVDFVDELETPAGRDSAPIKVSIVDSASYNSSPVSPQPVRNLGLGVVLGLLLGFGLAVVRELLDTTVKTVDDIADSTEAPVMATIAFDSQATKRPLVTDLDSHAPRVEAFRVLRTNMQFVDVDGGNKIFVVSSSVPTEGKTTTAVNLALTLAAAGQKVLLVDGDLRRPRVADILGLEKAVGLTTVLLGRISINEAIQPDSHGGLDVLTSGAVPPNPSELLQSHAMRDVLTDLRAAYDIVIIDAPPLLPVTDAALLGSQSDGVLLVVRHGRTTRDQLGHAVERLENVDAKAIGVVMNMIPVRRGGSSYYGYGYGYGYGYAPDSATAPKDGGRRKRKAEKGVDA